MIDMAYLAGKPVLILKENTEEIKGKNALSVNIQAIKTLSTAIKSTFGPRGLNKMIIDSMGDITVSGNGARILEQMGVEHPAAKMIVDLSKSINKNVGDGIKSSVILIGELLTRTEEMISQDLSPTTIYEGYIRALRECKTFLKELAVKVDLNDEKIIKNVISTALNSKSLVDLRDQFTDILYSTFKQIMQKENDKFTLDLDDLQIIKKVGKSLSSSHFVPGIIVDKEVVSSTMPKSIKNAKIALIDGALEITKTDFSSEIKIALPTDIGQYLKQEEQIIKGYVDSIQKTGANVVFCQKGIDETAQHFLTQHGIMAIRRVKHSDMVKLSKTCGAPIITQIKSISSNDLGSADLVNEQKLGNENMVFVEGCKNPKAVSVIIRGGTELIIDEAERSLKNGLAAARNLLESPYIVYGGGSIEIELHKKLIAVAQKIGGKQQISIENFANALEIIPISLIENTGMDPLDILTNLHAKVDYSKQKYFGFDAFTNAVVDVKELGLLEPINLKNQIYRLAAEFAISFIRIDDFIRSSKKTPK